jgi:hypothetical protein
MIFLKFLSNRGGYNFGFRRSGIMRQISDGISDMKLEKTQTIPLFGIPLQWDPWDQSGRNI